LFELIAVLGLSQTEATQQVTIALILEELHIRPVTEVAGDFLPFLSTRC
jgi:hypothetical protein